MEKKKNMMPIEWHEECLNNSTKYYKQMLAQALRMKEEAEAGLKSCEHKAKKIEAAKLKGIKEIPI